MGGPRGWGRLGQLTREQDPSPGPTTVPLLTRGAHQTPQVRALLSPGLRAALGAGSRCTEPLPVMGTPNPGEPCHEEDTMQGPTPLFPEPRRCTCQSTQRAPSGQTSWPRPGVAQREADSLSLAEQRQCKPRFAVCTSRTSLVGQTCITGGRTSLGKLLPSRGRAREF